MLHFERPPFKPSHASTPLTVDPFEVTLQPMQIRTFLLHWGVGGQRITCVTMVTLFAYSQSCANASWSFQSFILL